MTKKIEETEETTDVKEPQVEVEHTDGSVQSFTGSGQKQRLVTANVSCFGLKAGETGAVPDDVETQLAIANGYLTPTEPVEGEAVGNG